MKRILSATLILVLGLSMFSCTKEELPVQKDTTATDVIDFRSETIVDIALGNPDFSILVDAVVRANLVGALSQNGSFTVFAPTNDAFDAFLSDNGFSDIDDVPIDVLTSVLTTHVLNGEFFAADLTTGYVKTLANGPGFNNPTDIFINTASGVTINGDVNVVIADVDASNGVVHAIDKVIAPSSIVTLAASNPNFSSLVAAVTRPDLSVDFVAALSADGPFTVLAPTNAAFQALLDSNPAWNTLNDIPAATLEAVLSYHVAAGVNYTSSFLIRRPTVQTLLAGATYTTSVGFSGGFGGGFSTGGSLDLDIIAGSNTANVVAANVQAQNGVIHAIDAVILP